MKYGLKKGGGGGVGFQNSIIDVQLYHTYP